MKGEAPIAVVDDDDKPLSDDPHDVIERAVAALPKLRLAPLPPARRIEGASYLRMVLAKELVDQRDSAAFCLMLGTPIAMLKGRLIVLKMLTQLLEIVDGIEGNQARFLEWWARNVAWSGKK